MRVIYHDMVRAHDEAEHGLEFVNRETLFRQSDFLSIHVPLNDETRHSVGAEELALMKPTSILINTARGPVVDEAELADALGMKQIAGAGLDVFEREPTVSQSLLALDNVVLAPHIASASVATRVRMCTMAAENAAAVLRGETPPNPVNPEVL